MLVLSRRESEKIVIPELGITLEVLRIKGSTVRIGIDAPRDIKIVRGELTDSAKRVAQGSIKGSASEPASEISVAYRTNTDSQIADAAPVVRESHKGYLVNRKSQVSTTDVIAC